MNFEEKRVQSELARLDSNLFLDKRWDQEGQYVYYCVCTRTPPGVDPLVAVEWRGPTGPYPLSLSLVDQVRSQEGSIVEAITAAKINNLAKRELARQELLREREEVVDSWKKDKTLGRYSLHTVPKDSHRKQVKVLPGTRKSR